MQGRLAKLQTVEMREPTVDPEKQPLREHVWALLQREGAARFPGAHGRIPNFVGAEACAARLGEIAEWRRAQAIKANPDSPQTAVRRRALEEGKIVYMAVPRLREEKCFLELDPRLIPSPSRAASIQVASSYGRAVSLDDMRKIDLVVCGSVVVNRRGERLGKGGGYSDLEFALARQAELISETTPILTTVHPLQIVREALPWRVHDIPVDYIVTPAEIIRTEPVHPRPRGILWEFLPAEKIAAIPILRQRFTRPRQ
jgi:5-formyltetrahydrofolate cyclo-ligase